MALSLALLTGLGTGRIVSFFSLSFDPLCELENLSRASLLHIEGSRICTLDHQYPSGRLRYPSTSKGQDPRMFLSRRGFGRRSV